MSSTLDNFSTKKMKEDLENGALSETMFACSDSGWINQSLFLDWFKFYIANTLPAQPVLIIEMAIRLIFH